MKYNVGIQVKDQTLLLICKINLSQNHILWFTADISYGYFMSVGHRYKQAVIWTFQLHPRRYPMW